MLGLTHSYTKEAENSGIIPMLPNKTQNFAKRGGSMSISSVDL